MRVRRKVRCVHCGEFFVPSPRLGKRQKTCGSEKCKRLQNFSAQKCWKGKNYELCRQNQKDWRSSHPGYWRDWRMNHPDYVARNRVQTRIRKTVSGIQGLQNKLDILQPTVKQAIFRIFPEFAKQTRSLSALSVAYMLSHDNQSQSQQEFESPWTPFYFNGWQSAGKRGFWFSKTSFDERSLSQNHQVLRLRPSLFF